MRAEDTFQADVVPDGAAKVDIRRLRAEVARLEARWAQLKAVVEPHVAPGPTCDPMVAGATIIAGLVRDTMRDLEGRHE